jgi:hypothetical protein
MGHLYLLHLQLKSKRVPKSGKKEKGLSQILIDGENRIGRCLLVDQQERANRLLQEALNSPQNLYRKLFLQIFAIFVYLAFH